jgi:23S rRNA (guanosine2251-2'-O)-methyltransferase
MSSTTPEAGAVVCGRNPVVELLSVRAASVDKVFLQRGANGEVIDEILKLAAAAAVPVQRVPIERMNGLAGKVRHQGVAALTAALRYATLEELLERIARREGGHSRLLYLDRVTDPRNLGAILRSAAAFGADGVIVPSSSSAPLNAATVKASAGAALKIPVVRASAPRELLDGLRERGYWIIGADGGATATQRTMNWARPVIIAMGSEGRGLGHEIREVCDELVAIPIVAGVESLNVSIAAAILMSAAFEGTAG